MGDSLKGWYFNLSSLGDSYTTGYYCGAVNSPIVTSLTLKDTVTFPLGITAKPVSSCVSFQPVGLGIGNCPAIGTSISPSLQLSIKMGSVNTTKTQTLTILPSGDIQYADN